MIAVPLTGQCAPSRLHHKMTHRLKNVQSEDKDETCLIDEGRSRILASTKKDYGPIDWCLPALVSLYTGLGAIGKGQWRINKAVAV